MRITYAHTAQISDIGTVMLDAIERSGLRTVSFGDILTCTTEDLKDFLKKAKKTQKIEIKQKQAFLPQKIEIKQELAFLQTVKDQIEGSSDFTGDIQFFS